ncbi:MAG TPA: YceI family protein [Acidimicrobiales bacterium]
MPDKPKTARRRWPWIALAVAVVLGAAGAYGIWWFLKDDAPAAVSLDRALDNVSTTTAAPLPTTAGSDTTEPVSGGVAGTWAVDQSLGEFSFDDATGSFVGFRIEEELRGIGSSTAVGRTPAVTGTITIEGTTLTATAIEADLSKLTTNESRRDSRARGALDTSQFPKATFTLTEPVDLGDGAASGAKVTVNAKGDLTIHGVTKPVQVAIEAQQKNGVIVVIGSLDVVFADYGVSVPSAPVVVSAEDHGIVEMQLLFTKKS